MMEISNRADEIQIEIYRGLTGEERLNRAAQLRELSLKLMEAGVRDANPQWSVDEIRHAVLSRLLSPDLFNKAYPLHP